MDVNEIERQIALLSQEIARLEALLPLSLDYSPIPDASYYTLSFGISFAPRFDAMSVKEAKKIKLSIIE